MIPEATKPVTPIPMLLPAALIRDATGLVRSVLNRTTGFAKQGMPTGLLVHVWQPGLRHEVERLTEAGLLPEETLVVNLHEDFSKNDPRASSDLYSLQTFEGYESGLRKVSDDNDANIARYYFEDKYVLFVMYQPGSDRILFADHLREGKRYKRSYFDSENLEVRVSWFSQSNQLEYDEYFTNAGRRYLVDECPGKYLGRIKAYDSHMNETVFDSRGELVHYWLTNFRSELVENSILISEYAFMFDGLQKLKDTNNCAVIYTLHSSHLGSPHRSGSPVKSELVQTLANLEKMDALVVLTPQQRMDLFKLTKATNIEVIPHAHPEPSPVAPDSIREHGLIVMVSRLTKEKQHAKVIKEFASQASVNESVKLELWGRGPLEQELRQLIKNLDMEGRIKLMGFSTEPLREYARAEIALFSSQYEGQSISLMEALSQGCVPVSFDFKYGPRMIIQDMINGAIVDMNDSEDLIATAFRLFANPELLNEFSRNCLLSLANFSQESNANSWAELFIKIKSSENLGNHDSSR